MDEIGIKANAIEVAVAIVHVNEVVADFNNDDLVVLDEDENHEELVLVVDDWDFNCNHLANFEIVGESDFEENGVDEVLGREGISEIAEDAIIN